jgi:hypothetical protein
VWPVPDSVVSVSKTLSTPIIVYDIRSKLIINCSILINHGIALYR